MLKNLKLFLSKEKQILSAFAPWAHALNWVWNQTTKFCVESKDVSVL